MEARKRARLSQKELKRIAGQLMNVDMDIMEVDIMEESLIGKRNVSVILWREKSLWPGARRFLLTVGSLGCR